MLRRTFLHLRGIGTARERALWRAGVSCWEDALRAKPAGLGSWAAGVPAAAETSIERLSERDAIFFSSRMPAAERWRLFDEFRDEAAFLDIETDWSGRVTVAGVLFGGEFRAFVRGAGAGLGGALDVLREARLVVTFFGAGFDLPVLGREWGLPVRPRRTGTGGPFREPSGVHLPWAGHLDLCPVLRSMGMSGGLKAVERSAGILRPEDLLDLRSEDAPRLWDEARRGDDRAMELLLRYNREDVVNLQALAELACARLGAVRSSGA